MKTKFGRNAKVFAIAILALIISLILFDSCNQEDFIGAQTKIKIFVSSPPSNDGLKSAAINREIQNGDTIDIWSMQDINIIFSAEVGGLPAQGSWYIYLDDADSDDEDFMTGNRPYSESVGSICAIKPVKLGLYGVNFKHANSNNWFSCFFRHRGIPGMVGDSQDNDYAFRLEKEIFQNAGGETKIGYVLYLKYSKDDFNSWGEINGIDPKNENNFKAVLNSGRKDYFNDGCRGMNIGTMFRLKVCKYSDYVCFRFFTDDFPPISETSSYIVHFYSGNLGCSSWDFPSAQRSSWLKDGGLQFYLVN